MRTAPCAGTGGQFGMENVSVTSLGAWELPEELRLLQQTARRFMVNEVKPVDDAMEHDAFAVPEALLAPLQAGPGLIPGQSDATEFSPDSV